MADNSNTRYVKPGSCSWCGHEPHTDECSSQIRTGSVGSKEITEKCPCTEHIYQRERQRPPTSPKLGGLSSHGDELDMSTTEPHPLPEGQYQTDVQN